MICSFACFWRWTYWRSESRSIAAIWSRIVRACSNFSSAENPFISSLRSERRSWFFPFRRRSAFRIRYWYSGSDTFPWQGPKQVPRWYRRHARFVIFLQVLRWKVCFIKVRTWSRSAADTNGPYNVPPFLPPWYRAIPIRGYFSSLIWINA